MDDQISTPREAPQTFEQELRTLAALLKELWITCGAPPYREVASRAPESQPLSVTGISEALNGKRLPEINYLMALVGCLLSFQNSTPVRRNDPALDPFREQWQKAKRLKQRRRKTSISPEASTDAAPQESPEPPDASQASHTEAGTSPPGSDPQPALDAARTRENDSTELFQALQSATTRIELLVEALYDRIPDTGYTLPGTNGAITTFSPCADLLAVSDLRIIRLWDPAAGRPIGKPFTGHPGHVRCLAFSPDGRLLASGDGDRAVRVWDLATGNSLGQPLVSHEGLVESVAFSPDGHLLASVDHHGLMLLRDPSTGTPHPGLVADKTVRSLAFSPDGKLATGEVGKIRLWDPSTGDPVGKPIRREGVVISLAFSPNGHLLASGGHEGSLCVWHLVAEQSVGDPLTVTEGVTCVTFSPDGRLLAFGDRSGTVRLWDVNRRRTVGGAFSGSHISISSLAFSRDSRVLAIGGPSGQVCLCRASTDWPDTGEVPEADWPGRKSAPGWRRQK
ncbi:WD40 repeat domain-containing protein [Streptomyces sp. NPDC004592]